MSLLPLAVGFMGAERALKNGYSNHGWMYGVPCWLGDLDAEGPKVAAKWAPLDLALMVGDWFLGWYVSMGLKEPLFEVEIGPSITTN